MSQTLWGIDLGGTKIEGVVIRTGDSIEVLSRLRVATEQDKGYEHIVGQIGKLVDLLKKDTGLEPQNGMGIGTPGVIEPSTQLLKNSNTTCLNGQPLGTDVRSALGLPCQFANDANCFAIAEALLGAAHDAVPNAESVIGTIMGTGVGGGIVVHGRAITGKQGIGGEWGHNFLDESGGPCYCGKSGCTERILSGPALEKYYQSISGKTKPLKEIIVAARAHTDAHASQTMDRLIYFFGKGIATLINLIDPDAIVLGGGLGNIDELYTLGVEEVKKHVFNHQLETLFLRPKLGDSAGVFGAALLSSRNH